MSIEHVYRCDACGKKSATPGQDGWVRLAAEYVPERPDYHTAQLGHAVKYPAKVKINDKAVAALDLCSPECAGARLFRA